MTDRARFLEKKNLSAQSWANGPKGNSLSNHPVFLELGTLTSQNFFIFALFVGIIKI